MNIIEYNNMNSEKTKNILWVVLSILALTSSYAVISYVNTYSKSIEPSAYRSFSISAEGKTIGVPDVAQFNFSIISEGEDLLKIQKENTNQANKTVEFLKNQGVDSKDIKTQFYNVYPKYTYYDCSKEVIYKSYPETEPRPCPPPKISGYTINQTISVKIRDFSKIGNILSGIVEYGANNVSGLQFLVDDQTKLEDEAREEAISKAKEKAQNIAKFAGFKLGRLLAIEEGWASPYYKNIPQSLGMGGATIESTPLPSLQIEPGSQEIKINVTLRYEIK